MRKVIQTTKRFMKTCLALSFMLSLCAFSAHAEDAGKATIAVAANFTKTATDLEKKFEEKTGASIDLVFGSSGKLVAQIENKAPFDAFFSADAKRPTALETSKTAVAGTRFTYAIGQLVLWSPKEGYVDDKGEVLKKGKFAHVAIANPATAPYGAAAQKVLTGMGLWDSLQGKIVQGNNIGQTYQFVDSGNAELGFVALSQVTTPGKGISGSYWMIPSESYDGIVQQAIQLTENKVAADFLNYVKTDPEAIKIIESYGYGVPASK